MKKIKTISNVLFFIFTTNFFWEISQMFLYNDHTDGPLNFIWVHIKASLGDVIIFLLIYALGILISQNRNWFLKKSKAKYFIASLLGFALAVIIERYALSISRWTYNDLMPVIPFFKVGLSPILQMILLPVVTLLYLNKNYQK